MSCLFPSGPPSHPPVPTQSAVLLIVCHFTQPCLTCFSFAHKIDGTKETLRAHVKIARNIFLGLKFVQILFFWVGKFFSYFLSFTKFPLFFGSDKFPAIFWGLPIFVSHT